MIFSFFKSLFKKNPNVLKIPESILLKKLKIVADDNDLSVFQNSTIYHHSNNFFIPLMILDKNRGIFLFEYKDWTYDDLKNAKAQRAKNQEASNNTLAFEKSHEFIKQKFNEIMHTDNIPIFNYLLMENLNSDEYEHLDDSLKELLPKSKILFSDSSPQGIIEKIHTSAISKSELPNVPSIMGTLLIQYAILNNSGDVHLASLKQMEFIDSPLQSLYTLKASPRSGKTSAVLLKAILEKLKEPSLHIIIISPTTLSCDILKKKLLDSVEHAIIEIDVTSIEIITPIDLINKHLNKLNQPSLKEKLYINPALIRKSFNSANLIICDDSNLYSDEFIGYLKHIQKKHSLILVETSSSKDDELAFNKNFNDKNKQSIYYEANQHAKAMQIISSLLKEEEAKEILVIGTDSTQEKLKEDLEFFIEDETTLLDSSKHMIDQDLDNVLLSSYSDIYSLDVKYAILMDVCSANIQELEYAYNLPKECVYILYEQECEKSAYIKGKYENT